MSDLSDPSTARTKLEFIQRDLLRDVKQVVDKLENVSSQVNAATERLKVVPSENKREMVSVAVALVRAVRELGASTQPGSRYANLVGLNDDGRKAVKGEVEKALEDWKRDLAPTINEAVQHGLATAKALGEVNELLKKIAVTQKDALRLQVEKEQEGFDWKRVGAFAAACFVSAVIGGLAVAVAVKSAPTVRQDLTLESGTPAAKSGKKNDAAKQEQR